MARYVEPRAARHRVEIVDGREQLRIPARRNWPTALFLGLWLALWSVGGAVVISELVRHFEPFLLLWLSFWAVGWLFAAGTLAMLIGGSEQVRVIDGDLELSAGVGRLRRTWRYRGAAIRELRRAETPSWGPWFVRNQTMPILLRPRSGAVQFDYGADTIFFASGVAGPEGGRIAVWLARRLPPSASVCFAEGVTE